MRLIAAKSTAFIHTGELQNNEQMPKDHVWHIAGIQLRSTGACPCMHVAMMHLLQASTITVAIAYLNVSNLEGETCQPDSPHGRLEHRHVIALDLALCRQLPAAQPVRVRRRLTAGCRRRCRAIRYCWSLIALASRLACAEDWPCPSAQQILLKPS